MPIVAGDIDRRYSGGAANSDPNASLGGAKSSTAATSGVLNNLFADADSAEAAAGSVKYRCMYIHNGHGTLTWQNVGVWIETQTPSPDTVYAIGLGTAAVNGTEQTIADEDTAPAGVTFSEPANEGARLVIGDIPPGEHKSVWYRRTISAAAAAFDDSAVTRAKGDTAA